MLFEPPVKRAFLFIDGDNVLHVIKIPRTT
jgi:hypothetical protein